MDIGDKIKKGRRQLGITQTELGRMLGVKKNAVSKWECGRVSDIPASKIRAMAELFNVPPSYLVDSNDSDDLKIYDYEGVSMIKTMSFPLMGNIACGTPTLAAESFEAYVNAGSNINADFCLRCKGDSMINARILDGDIVFIRKQSMVDNGDIAAVIVDNEATLKRVYYYPEQNKLVLQAENPMYPPFVYVGEELNQIRILGKAVAFQSDVR